MANNSSTGGYLAPAPTPAPLEGQALNRFIQQVVAGITGMDGTVVRPRWQAEPPNIPAAFTAWASVGVRDRPSDTFPYVGHDGDDNGSDTIQRHEELDVLCSFYDTGSSGEADANAAILRDGLAVAQNREYLQTNGFGLVGTGNALTVPSLLKERWLYRVDLPVTLRRVITRTYPVLNVLGAIVELEIQDADSQTMTETVTVGPPA